MLASVGGQAICGERIVIDPVGGTARRDGKRQPATAGTQEPLAAGAACGMVAAREPDLTLAEIVQRLWQDRQVATTDSSVDRFFKRHGLSFKKNSARRRAGTARRGRSKATLESSPDAP
jgi:transposase